MPDQNQELLEYAKKLKNQIQGIDRILSMNTYGLITPEMGNKLHSLKERAEKLNKKLETNECEIAIVGMEKAGKSTFANALMESDILPTKEARCTYTSTSIRFAKNDTAEIKFFTREEFNDKLNTNLTKLHIPHADTLSFESLELNDYKAMFEQLDDKIKTDNINKLNKDIEDILQYKNNILKYLGRAPMEFPAEGDLEGNYFKRFIQDPKFAIAVKEITIRSSKLNSMQNAVIYDVPGFNSPTKMHRDQTIEKMRLADVILLILNAHEPNLTVEELDIFQTETDDDGIQLGDKMFVFANRADMSEDLNNNLTIIQNDLEKNHIMTPAHRDRIVAGSAKAKLDAVHGENSFVLKGLKRSGLKNDGIDLIKQKISSYNKKERFEVLKARANRIQAELENLFRDLSKQQSIPTEQNLAVENGSIMIDLFSTAQEAIRNNLQVYRSRILQKFDNNSRPLTARLRTDVLEKITVEQFGVTEEDLERVSYHKDITTNMDSLTDMDRELRKEKKAKISKNFLENVTWLAISEHNECDNEIFRIFMDGLSVDETNPYYGEIKNNIMQYINDQRGAIDNKGYYKSLIERFSADLFDILLYFSYGSDDRWNNFEKASRNIYSLAVFDSKYDPKADQRNPRLPHLLLFQESEDELKNYMEQALKFISSLLDSPPDQKITDLIAIIVKKEGEQTYEHLQAIFPRTFTNQSSHAKYNIVFHSLEDAVSQYSSMDTSEKDSALTREEYHKYFAGKKSKRREDIQREINTDINILREILSDTIANAINIEKPFLNLETQTIENLIISLNGEYFRNFIKNNAYYIKSTQYSHAKAEGQKRLIKQNILAEIETVLREMKGTKRP